VATLTSGTSPVVLADRTQTIDCAPDITLTTPPDGTTYTRGRTVLADYSCADRGSGVSTCGGDVADNAAIDTSVLGAHTFTVQATDGGGRQRTVVNDYDVVPATCQGHSVTVDLRFGETPTAGPDVIVGTPGADVIRGHGGADVICGWGGKDVIHGGAGRDSIWGGVGNDTLSAGKGGGLLAGQQGADRLNGGQQADALRGGPGADTLHGGLAPDTGDGGPDTDECYLFPGYDVYVDCEIIALP
jgi:Ca2+-binding RTX toxin-like protein